MKNTVLQIPMSKDLRERAEKASNDLGFSSLQETVRVFLSKFSSGKITLSFEEQFPEEKLSVRKAKEYDAIIKDMRAGRNVKTAKNIEDFLSQLNSL